MNPEGLVPAAGPGVGECLQDSSAPVRLAAERCAFHLFQLSRGPKIPRFLFFIAERNFESRSYYTTLMISLKNVQKPPCLALSGFSC